MDEYDVKEQEKLVRYMGKLYQRSKRNLQVEGEEGERYFQDMKFVMTIDLILKDMRKEQQLIIRKDYLQTPVDMWYRHYFSRSSYYRIRNKAIKEFVAALY
mgnify:FL=1